MSHSFEAILGAAREDRKAGRLREALTGYERAADLARSVNDWAILAHAQRHVGDLHFELGQYRMAESAAREAVSLYRHHDGNVSLDLANALRVLALALESLGQVADADDAWRKARSLYTTVGVVAGVLECDQHLTRSRRA